MQLQATPVAVQCGSQTDVHGSINYCNWWALNSVTNAHEVGKYPRWQNNFPRSSSYGNKDVSKYVSNR